MDASHRPKSAETIVHETVRLREAKIGRRCEVLCNTRIEYASLGDYSYLGENCEVADAVIGKFTAVANSVRMALRTIPWAARPASLHLLPGILRGDGYARPRFLCRASKRPRDRRQRLLDRACCHSAAGRDGRRRRGDSRGRSRKPQRAALYDRRRRSRARDPKRFPDSVAERLRRIAWWNWPDEIIFERLSDFRSEAIEQFCERYDPALAPGR